MNTQMESTLPREKLDRRNFSSWEYRMNQYLVGQGYWGYIKGLHEKKPDITDANYQSGSKEQVA